VAPGHDADLVVWYPAGKGETIIRQERRMMVNYTPYERVKVRNWPILFLKGKVA